MMANHVDQHMITIGELIPEAVLSTELAAKPVFGMSIDSRNIQQGYLFVAVEGIDTHGKLFAEQAANKGAVAVLIDEKEDFNLASVPLIRLPNLQQRLSHIAGCFYGHPSRTVPVIGITGTNGKTTCCQLLGQAYAHLQESPGVIGTLGYGIISLADAPLAKENANSLTVTGMTTADAIHTQLICDELLSGGASHIVMEVSSHGMEQHRVAAIDINTAVFTNLSHDHLDYHGTMEAYGNAKAQLFLMPSLASAVINQDDDFAGKLIDLLPDKLGLYTYSLTDGEPHSQSKAHFYLNDINVSSLGVTANLVVVENKTEKHLRLTTQLIGSFNLYNLLAVISSLYANHPDPNTIIGIVNKLTPVVGRMELIPNDLGIQVVIDYAHTPDALANALQALKPHCNGFLWCLFGCGGDRDREKRPEMAAIAESLADKVIVTSDNPRTESQANIFQDIQAGFKQDHPCVANRSDAIDLILSQAKSGDTVLIAGKGHEDYQIIGQQKFPFSDQQHARLVLGNLQQRGAYD